MVRLSALDRPTIGAANANLLESRCMNRHESIVRSDALRGQELFQIAEHSSCSTKRNGLFEKLLCPRDGDVRARIDRGDVTYGCVPHTPRAPILPLWLDLLR